MQGRHNKKIKLLAVAVILTAGLSGCKTLEGLGQPRDGAAAVEAAPVVKEPSPEEILEQKSKAAFNLKVKQIARLTHAVCISQKHRAYFAQTACLPSGLTEKQLSSKRKITRNEANAARSVFSALNNLNSQMRDWMRASGYKPYVERAERSEATFVPAVTALQNDLLKGRITWGEYNRRRQALFLGDTSSEEDQPN